MTKEREGEPWRQPEVADNLMNGPMSK